MGVSFQNLYQALLNFCDSTELDIPIQSCSKAAPILSQDVAQGFRKNRKKLLKTPNVAQKQFRHTFCQGTGT